jgi:hypothetical protein
MQLRGLLILVLVGVDLADVVVQPHNGWEETEILVL